MTLKNINVLVGDRIYKIMSKRNRLQRKFVYNQLLDICLCVRINNILQQQNSVINL